MQACAGVNKFVYFTPAIGLIDLWTRLSLVFAFAILPSDQLSCLLFPVSRSTACTELIAMMTLELRTLFNRH
jgi:hypothetical protein